MTNTANGRPAGATPVPAAVPVSEVIAAARELALGGRWHRATTLLDAAGTATARDAALLALAAAEAALLADWFAGSRTAAGRIATAQELCAEAGYDAASRWDLAFLRAREDYSGLVLRDDGGFAPGPDGKDPAVIADLRRRTDHLRDQALDPVRRGWAEMYLGLIADNVAGERGAAPAHYEAALRGGESGDDLLRREALRHLGDHDHDGGDHERARERWSRATELGARAGTVPGTLSQQMLLAVLARDAGDEAGAAALAGEIVRWADAIGASRLAAQARGFLSAGDSERASQRSEERNERRAGSGSPAGDSERAAQRSEERNERRAGSGSPASHDPTAPPANQPPAN